MCIRIAHMIFLVFLPMMILSMLNIKVYMTMQMMRQRLEAKRMNRDDGRFSNNKGVGFRVVLGWCGGGVGGLINVW